MLLVGGAVRGNAFLQLQKAVVCFKKGVSAFLKGLISPISPTFVEMFLVSYS